MKKDQEKQLWKKVLKITTFAVVFSGIAVGSFFGIYSTTKTGYETDAHYKNSYTFQVKVNETSTNTKSIEEIAKDTQQRAELFGYEQTIVTIVGDDSLTLTFPIESMEDESAPYTYSSQEDVLKDIIIAYSSIFSKYNLEIRDPSGQQMFQYVEGEIKFIEPQPPVDETAPANLASSESDPISSIPVYDVELIKPGSARIEYVNGTPFLTVEPINDHVWQEFQAAATFLVSNATEENPYGNMYAVWFGYDAFAFLIDQVDPEGLAAVGGETELLSYAFTDTQGNPTDVPKDIAEPFLVGVGTVTQELNPWDKKIPLTLGGLTLEQYEQAVNQINFSTDDYEFELIDTSYNEAQLDDTTLMYVTIFLGIIIAAVIFTMMWYFGLLGMIASLSIAVFSLIPLAILSSFALPITGTIVFGLCILILITTVVAFTTLNIMKQSIWEKQPFKDSFKKSAISSYSRNVSMILMLTLVLFGMSIIAPPVVQTGLYFIILTTMSAYILVTGLTLLIGFAFMKVNGINHLKTYEGKWSIHFGKLSASMFSDDAHALASKTLGSTATTKNTKIVAFLSIFVVILSFGLFGILSTTTGTWGNTTPTGGIHYRYDVVLTEYFDTEDNAGPDPDPYNQQEQLEIAKQNQDAVEEAFEANSVNVQESSIVRKDNYIINEILDPESLTPEFEDYYEFSYGVTIISNEEISQEQFTSINTALAGVGAGYELSLTYSLTNFDTTGTAVTIENYSNFASSQQTMYGLFIAAGLVFGVSLVIYRWSFSIATTSSIALELITTAALTMLIFVPITNVFFMSLFGVLGFSVISKVIINRNARLELKRFANKDEKHIKTAIHNGVTKSTLSTVMLGLGMVLVGSVLLTSFGAAYITYMMTMLFGALITIIYNFTLYPVILQKLETKRWSMKQDLLEADINLSKSKTSVEEEYIKGINY